MWCKRTREIIRLVWITELRESLGQKGFVDFKGETMTWETYSQKISNRLNSMAVSSNNSTDLLLWNGDSYLGKRRVIACLDRKNFIFGKNVLNNKREQVLHVIFCAKQ